MTILTGLTLVGLGFLFGIFRTRASIGGDYTRQIKKSGYVLIDGNIYKTSIVEKE